ncbi:myotubularin-related protein 4 isoform X2 [Entelurus aequoreus]|uniref:myotubularin-related protein 4 isoform X2 n=1 Tax=Entelurus aequoreus TaxID=161455 RepID=UPI002B1D56B8|nr:myotubularin-related protein 4 isoform X2 [Entelurus aequoreus]XP_061904236.1 myotubularin-related protein 4 isoform X2 [Entelurus aequoreus]XP_061904237.1 myotubularin-related protein 4 isoform X2 [Entelurus aequoreus]XP_061904238.1 myotubularin-related protein 4 isoform X2 [Entelurus aequoreus]
MGEEGPPSLEYIKAKDLFPQKELVKEDTSLQIPFPVLQGEGVEYLGHAVEAVIAISNYRLHIKFKDSVINVPLRLIESVESRDMFQLYIICKDSKIVRCHFTTFKLCQEWVKRLTRALAHPSRLEDLFALAYHAWCLGGSADDEDQHVHLCRPGDHVRQRMEVEVKRMGFDTQNIWRMSDINSNYKLCSSYPQKLLVPIWITDKELDSVASFRSWKRIPVVVYRHQKNGAVIARCSQPEISWWGWRNTDDEYLVTSIAKACQMDTGSKGSCEAPTCQQREEAPDSSDSDFDSSLTGNSGCDDNTVPQKLLILDARSYTAAVANRAKGGGCECEEYYPNCEVMFMGMANIHAIRNSFQALRTVCSQIPDPGNWLSALESTRWLQHLSVMLKAATLVCSSVEREGRPVLVHCSDGWDRTPQIVALAKILLDPYYRTLEGFQVLVETEWLDYGHKFGDRCGHQENADDVSEQCPVFLQWLDCVHQLLKQFPCLFEFNEAFLVKLVQHTYSCLYGTFLCNNAQEREAKNIYKRTCSVWSLLRTGNKNFQNFLYILSHDVVLQPVCHTRALQLWTAVYLPTSSPCTAVDDSMELYLSQSVTEDELASRSFDRLPKTRSMDNLLSAFENGLPLTRTSSDPNLNKHCQEGRPTLEAVPVPNSTCVDCSDEVTPDSCDGEPLQLGLTKPSDGDCEVPTEEPCLTTQPLPSLPLPPVQHTSDITHAHTPLFAPVLLHTTTPAFPTTLLEAESPYSTVAVTLPPTPKSEMCLPLTDTTQPSDTPVCPLLDGHNDSQENDEPQSADLMTLKLLMPLPPLEDSTETLTDQGEPLLALPYNSHNQNKFNNEEQQTAAVAVELHEEDMTTDVVREKDQTSALGESPIDYIQGAAHHLISQSPLPDMSLFGSHWEGVQGLMKSSCSSASHCVSRSLQVNTYQSHRLAQKLLRSQGFAIPNSSQCCRREALCPSSPLQPAWPSATRSAGYTSLSSAAQNICSLAGYQLSAVSHPSPFASSSPPPQAPSYLDDDGLPVPMDAVQQRLRQIEAGYKQEVEVLRQQVRQLQMRLESKQYSTPPSEPDVDYEDDITCLRESDSSHEEDSLSTHSEDRLSEGSWDRVESKDTEVTRWVPDHMASHCFNCDCEFWIAKRRHHCRNCGNVFCKDCCHLKLPIPDQQLYDPVLVCNICHDLLLTSRTRELRSQQFKKAIATASS